MKKLLLATHNVAKINELRQMLSDLPLELVTLTDLDIATEVEEDADTYLENSQKKALGYAKMTNLPAISDDGGLEIVALNNAPGVHSKRWLGYEATEEELLAHMQKIALELPDNNREAVFKTVVSFALPTGHVWSGKGESKGIIAKKPSTTRLPGFPYRSFFFLPDINKYFFEHELTAEELQRYNHRRKAIEKLKPLLITKLSVS